MNDKQKIMVIVILLIAIFAVILLFNIYSNIPVYPSPPKENIVTPTDEIINIGEKSEPIIKEPIAGAKS